MKLIALIRQTSKSPQSDFDRSAVEAALRLKEQTAAEVTAVCLGCEKAKKHLRQAAAMGCDKTLLITTNKTDTGSGKNSSGAAYMEPLCYASILAEALQKLDWDAIITSCYAVDADTIQTGFLIAELLSLTAVGYAEEISIQKNGAFLVRRQFEDRTQLLELPVPCLISALPKPGQRIYMSADGITRAYSIEIPVLEITDLQSNPRITLFSSEPKEERRRGHVLTVPTKEAVSRIMETMIRSHIV